MTATCHSQCFIFVVSFIGTSLYLMNSSLKNGFTETDGNVLTAAFSNGNTIRKRKFNVDKIEKKMVPKIHVKINGEDRESLDCDSPDWPETAHLITHRYQEDLKVSRKTLMSEVFSNETFAGNDNVNVNGKILRDDRHRGEASSHDREPLLPPLSEPEDDDDEFRTKVIDESVKQEEKSFSLALQVLFPFLIAGFGTVSAGLLLDVVQHWKVYKEVSEIFILVPALLGLKGNLEMTLASRLSTAANVGHMDSRSNLLKLTGGNLALLQVQATVVGTMAAFFAAIMGWVKDGESGSKQIHHATLLCASSLVTATLASLILGSLMVAVILFSRKCGINPDNVATPIAASLGDLTTLALLSGISGFLYKCIGTHHWIAPLISLGFFLILPLWIYITHRNHFTHDILYSGWTPVISAMVISSVGGLILDFAVNRYHGIAVYNPVINGVGGNLVAVQASRLSTALHTAGKPGKLPNGVKYGGCVDTFCGGGSHSRAARVLLFLSIPGHMIFLYTIHAMQAGHTTPTLKFTGSYLVVGLLQVAILLLVCHWMVQWMWKRGNDPDNYSIPYLTALGDLLGTSLLALCFWLLWLVGDHDSDVGD